MEELNREGLSRRVHPCIFPHVLCFSRKHFTFLFKKKKERKKQRKDSKVDVSNVMIKMLCQLSELRMDYGIDGTRIINF